MEVPVGPHVYAIRMVEHDLTLRGEPCEGWCDVSRHEILIRRDLPPSRRIAVCWHELAHAWQLELNVTAQSPLPEEAMCNLVALAMAQMTPEHFHRLYEYLLNS